MSVHVHFCHLPMNDVKNSTPDHDQKSRITNQKHNTGQTLYYPNEEHFSLVMVTHYMSFVT
jgi:hypothetical protein